MYRIETKKDARKLLRTIVECCLLLLLVFAWVLSPAKNAQYHPYDPNDPQVVSKQDRGFLALSYFGIDRQRTDTLLSLEQLDAQLGSLHSLGYVTVSQQDVIDYYTKGTPLPDKALFLLFEDGRRDTALFAERILKKYNYRATILSYAEKFGKRDPKFLSAKDLQTLSKTGFWELGTNGYRLSFINAYDRYGRFLSQLTSEEFVGVHRYLDRDYNHYLMDYLRNEDRIPTESPREMESRITQDYQNMQDIYTRELGNTPALYCLMHANTGQFGTNAAASRVNQENIENLFRLNFNRDGFSVNSRASSPLDLTRIQPQSGWSTNHLLMRLWDDLPDSRKGEILFVSGDPRISNEEAKLWDLKKGVVEYQRDSILLTSLPKGEGLLYLKDRTAENLTVDMDLLGNVVGSQSIFLRTNADCSRCVTVTVENHQLVVSEKNEGESSELFRLDLFDLLPEEERLSREADARNALAAEYSIRGKYADTPADRMVFYAEARKAKNTPAVLAQGSDVYVPRISINDQGSTHLNIQLNGDSIHVLVDGQDVTGSLPVSIRSPGGIAIASGWGGWGYSQRNIADDVYDGVFHNLTITADGNTLYSNRLHGLDRVLSNLQNTWNSTVSWFLSHL